MKIKTIVMVAAVVSLVAAHAALAAAPACGDLPVLTACVGGNDLVMSCTQSYENDYVVTAADVANSKGQTARFCLQQTGSSLCPNTSAIATVTRNGKNPQTGDLNADGGGDVIEVKAKEGDVIQIVVVQQPRKNGIQCFRQGEVQFALTR
ncbi:MAG: hypothetical protein OEQ13_13850 [Acidobacteriota bacterium]|nr:hypothetical protein [Acidobacteriota bacterium]